MEYSVLYGVLYIQISHGVRMGNAKAKMGPIGGRGSKGNLTVYGYSVPAARCTVALV